MTKTREMEKLRATVYETEKLLKSEKGETSKLRSELQKKDKLRLTNSNNAPSQNVDLSLIDTRLQLVEERTKSIQNDLERIAKSSTKWEKNSGDVTNLSKTINAHQKSLQTMYEKEREKHIIATGVKENGDVSDADNIRMIFDVINCTHISPVTVSRLGKERGKEDPPRPILIVLTNTNERQQVLDCARSLKGAGTEYATIFLKKDLHPDIRKEWKRMRDVCRAEKVKPKNGGCKIFIDYKQGVLKIDDTVIDRYRSPFRPHTSDESA